MRIATMSPRSSKRQAAFGAGRWQGTTRALLLSGLLGAAAASGCSQITDACTRELRWKLEPQARTLNVGESFTPELALSGCGGRERLTDVASWQSADARVVAVDARTGRVAALATGQTTVTVTTERYGVHGAIQVTVAE